MTRRIEFTVPDALGEKYDRARLAEGGADADGEPLIPMATWIKRNNERALESALGSSEARDASVDRGAPTKAARPAPTRTPKKKPSIAETWRR